MAQAFKSNIRELLVFLRKRDIDVHIALNQGLLKGMRYFESKMIREQLTGRPGLKRVTGVAASAWSVRLFDLGDEAYVTLGAGARAWYLKVHQHINFNGEIRPKTKKFLRFKTDNGWRTAKRVCIPKRLHIPEDFEASGPKIMRSHIKSELRKLQKSVGG